MNYFCIIYYTIIINNTIFVLKKNTGGYEKYALLLRTHKLTKEHEPFKGLYFEIQAAEIINSTI